MQQRQHLLQSVRHAALQMAAPQLAHRHVSSASATHNIAATISNPVCIPHHTAACAFHTHPPREKAVKCVTKLLLCSIYVTSCPSLRSTSSQRYERARTRLKFGERSFSCAGPRAWIPWNSLPSSLQELTDAKTFKRKLKTFLFQQAYH